MLIILMIGLVVLTVSLIAAGLWSMQQEKSSLRPASSLTGPLNPELPSASNPPAPPLGLQWTRPTIVPGTLTWENASLSLGLGVLWMLSFLMLPLMALFWVGVHDPSAWSSYSPFVYVSWLPFLCVPLLLPLGMLIKGMREWQKINALERRGQLTQGVLLDRWSGFYRASVYSVAYYFELPGGIPGDRPVIRAENNKEAHRTYQVGDPVRVRYLPDNPQVCRLEA